MQQLSQIYPISLLITAVLALSGCNTFGYYHQAVSGHLSLMLSTQPVTERLADPGTPPLLNAKLMLSQQARRFAASDLALPVGDAFSEFAELDRPWVLVNLVAVPEFSLTPHRWCYPVIGCQAYRGYFDLEQARQQQRTFKNRGFDTFIGGVTAYSTLGWFDDPLHSGFTRLSDDHMVALMFHELAHQVVYVDADTAFNESFATAVELEGLKRWLNQRGHPDGFQRALDRLRQRQETLRLVRSAAAKLQRLYDQQTDLSLDDLRAQKSAVLETLRADYLMLAANWTEPGPLGSDPGTLNNANLALFNQYNQHVPAFRALFRESGEDFAEFYNAVKTLAKLPEEQRNLRLQGLGQRFSEHL